MSQVLVNAEAAIGQAIQTAKNDFRSSPATSRPYPSSSASGTQLGYDDLSPTASVTGTDFVPRSGSTTTSVDDYDVRRVRCSKFYQLIPHS